MTVIWPHQESGPDRRARTRPPGRQAGLVATTGLGWVLATGACVYLWAETPGWLSPALWAVLLMAFGVLIRRVVGKRSVLLTGMMAFVTVVAALLFLKPGMDGLVLRVRGEPAEVTVDRVATRLKWRDFTFRYTGTGEPVPGPPRRSLVHEYPAGEPFTVLVDPRGRVAAETPERVASLAGPAVGVPVLLVSVYLLHGFAAAVNPAYANRPFRPRPGRPRRRG
ncbi:hypothetical protein I3F58_22980 [Streptomyces sp. MUM 203J]|uniref:hypothetical protein n=1 Tax=Streptomyces sp. MUM 203J TaxID=2791990 RepID=UPI001F033CE6|nr:hypothetical protein [Streptomyces sp. MUM 203J]MCH0542363.1 hypothetical protein [Streptomyces sp. MUM 203J]